MLQHASLEVDAAQVSDCVAFWELLGFTRMEPPPKLRSRFTWVEREGTQIHLIPAEPPGAPAQEGHVAVGAEDSEWALAALRAPAFEPYDGQTAWDAPRSFGRAPVAHLVEVRSRPPLPPWP